MQTSDTILFLTDIHINEKEKQKLRNYFSEMEQFLLAEQIAERISFLVITGDITCTGSVEEYQEAGALLGHLAEEVLKLSPGHVHICPGNHDGDSEKVPGRFAHYHRFLNSLLGRNQINQDEELLFTLINSCTRCTLKEPDRAVLLEKDRICRKEQSEMRKIKILGMHHQPEVFQDRERIDSIIRSYEVVLYGHTHVREIGINTVNGTVLINGCAFHTPEQEDASSFQIIETGNELIITSYYNKDEKIRIQKHIQAFRK